MENSFDLYKDEKYIVPGAEAAPDLNYKPSSQKIKESQGEQATPTPTAEPTAEPTSEAKPAEKPAEKKEEPRESWMQTIFAEAQRAANPLGYLLNYDGPGAEELQKSLKDIGGSFNAVKDYLNQPVKNNYTPTNIRDLKVGGELETFATDPRESIELAASVPMGGVDFAFDVIGNNKLLSPVDDFWDERTKFQTPIAKELRSIASVVVPSMVGGAGVSSATARMSGANTLTKRVSGITGRAVVDATVARVSDYSERDEGVMNALDGVLDGMGNPMGMNIPEAAKIQDGDSMQTRHTKLQWEAAGFSVFGDVLGYLLGRGKKLMSWLDPKDEDAKTFVEYVKSENPDIETIEMVSQYRKMAEEAGDDVKKRRAYNEFADLLVEEMKETGVSRATTDPMESYARKQQNTRDMQNDEVASVHVLKSMQDGATAETIPFKPEVHKDLVEEADTFKSAPAKASVARNAADMAAMGDGKDYRTTVPNQVISDAEIENGYQLNEPSSSIIRAKAEEARSAGNYDALVEDARYTQRDRDNDGWSRVAKTLVAGDADEVRKLYMSRRDAKFLRGKYFRYLNSEASRDASIALKFLVDTFLDPDTAMTSARATETLGREASAVAEAMRRFKGSVNEDKAMEVIMNKMAFLFEERGMAKYVAGWSLQNVGWWKKLGKSEKGLAKLEAEQLEKMAAGFTDAQRIQREKAAAMVDTFYKLRKQDPEKARLFAAAVDHSEGNIDTLDKLNKFIENQVSLGGLFIDPSGKGGNLFGSTLKSIWYNNVLSGASAGKAAVGGATQQLMQPLEYFIGAGIDDLLTGGKYQQVKSGFYAYNSVLSANKAALGDAWAKFMKASRDPQSVEAAIRADYRMKNDEAFELLEQSIPTLEKEGKMGQKNDGSMDIVQP